jgi:hypothetical protein
MESFLTKKEKVPFSNQQIARIMTLFVIDFVDFDAKENGFTVERRNFVGKDESRWINSFCDFIDGKSE